MELGGICDHVRLCVLCLERDPALFLQCESQQVERAQSASVESIPEVLEDRDSVAEQSDSASVHDMDYVNPRGVRFTQPSQKDGKWRSIVLSEALHSSRAQEFMYPGIPGRGWEGGSSALGKPSLSGGDVVKGIRHRK